jgi:sortase A
VKSLRAIERLLLTLGLLLLLIYLAAHLYSAVLSRAELRRFQDRNDGSSQARNDFSPASENKLDVSLWSQKRIAGYEKSLAVFSAPPVAVLRIDKVHLEVPVLEGTDDFVLDRGVGHIAGTVSPGEEGNSGIAGHRDGFFRVLKDVSPGDIMELVTVGRTETFVVEEILIVDPHDISVLAPRPFPTLTLVTCYPFYYIGSAPQRYIVRASIVRPESPKLLSYQQLSGRLTSGQKQVQGEVAKTNEQ